MVQHSLLIIAQATTANDFMKAYFSPILAKVNIFASLICMLCLIIGGVLYITSSGNLAKLGLAKKVIRNALIGLAIVLAAESLVAIANHLYGHTPNNHLASLPDLHEIKSNENQSGLVGVLVKAVTGLLNNIVQSAALPFLDALSYFTDKTPLIADNPGVFNLWLSVLGVTDVLFVLVVALLGFHVMSAASFGFEEINLKQILPRFGLIFTLANSSVFIIDGLIGISNVMINAVQLGFSQPSVWHSLSLLVKESDGMGLTALLVMVAFIILCVILLVYYLGRIVAIYLGAVLSPLICLIWLIPGFRHFSESVAKAYLLNIFVIFVHVIILLLASTLFVGVDNTLDHNPGPLMSMALGISTLVALLKTQGVMSQLSYANMSTTTIRKLSTQMMNGISYMTDRSVLSRQSLITLAKPSLDPLSSINGGSSKINTKKV